MPFRFLRSAARHHLEADPGRHLHPLSYLGHLAGRRREAARLDILDYFDLAWDVAARFAEFKKSKKYLSKTDRKFRRIGHLLVTIADELEIAHSSVQQLRKCGQVFRDAWVHNFLSECRRIEYLPCRETFIALSSVPKPALEDLAQLVLEEQWSADQIKTERKRCFGIRSNGGRTRQLPRTLEETKTQISQTRSQFAAICSRLQQVQEGVSCPPEDLNFRVTPAVWEHARKIRDELALFEKRLAGCDGKGVV